MDKVLNKKKLFQVTKSEPEEFYSDCSINLNNSNKIDYLIPNIDEIDLRNEESKFIFNQKLYLTVDYFKNLKYLVTNEWINRIIYYIKTRYYQSDFNKLIKFFNSKIPKFLHKNEYILYTIMKYILFDKIRIGETEESKKFYFEYFLHFLKKTHTKSWKRKNMNFLIIMSNPQILVTYDYLVKSEQNFQNFILVCERDLYNFVYKKKNSTNFDDFEDLNQPTYDYSNHCLSDLEDQLIYNSENFKHLNKIEFQNHNKPHNTPFYSEIDPLKDRSSNFYNMQKEYTPKFKKEMETLKEQIPLLKNFNPAYTKRVNIDKKVIRKFKNYLKEKKDVLNLNGKDVNNFNFTKLSCEIFWQNFIKEKLMPPFKYFDVDSKSEVEFKSFNTKFLVWMFSKENATNYYEEFLNDEGKDLIESLIKDYELENMDKEKEQLQFYIYHLAQVFSNFNLNDRTSNSTYFRTNGNQIGDFKNFKENKEELSRNNNHTNSNYTLSSIRVNSLSTPNESSIFLNNNLNISLTPSSGETSTINTEAPLNPLSFEKVYENYLGLGKDFDKDLNRSKKDLFDMVNESYRESFGRGVSRRDIRKNRNLNKKYDSDSDRSLDRSRELDYMFFDNLKKSWSDFSSDKEE